MYDARLSRDGHQPLSIGDCVGEAGLAPSANGSFLACTERADGVQIHRCPVSGVVRTAGEWQRPVIASHGRHVRPTMTEGTTLQDPTRDAGPSLTFFRVPLITALR